MMFSDRVSLDERHTLVGTRALSQFLWVMGTAALTGVAARLEIPHEPVPFTLQTLVVLLAGAFLGPVNGALSQIAYLGAGLAGLPVFAGGMAGPLAVIGSTGGYLLAFPIAAALIGLLIRRDGGLLRTIGSMAVGLLCIFLLGTTHLYAFYLHKFPAAVSAGFLIFSWWDLLKLCAAAMIYHEIAKRWWRVG